MARRVKGGDRIRTILRGMPSAYRKEMADVLDSGGKEIAPAMQTKAPSKSGTLRRGISWKVYPQSLRLKVGLVNTKAGRSDLFYGRIQDLGRRGQNVTIRRGRLRGKIMRVRAMAAKHFVTGQFSDLRSTINTKLKGIFGRALARISGSGNG